MWKILKPREVVKDKRKVETNSPVGFTISNFVKIIFIFIHSKSEIHPLFGLEPNRITYWGQSTDYDEGPTTGIYR